jgi:hypothetical protein
MFLTKAETTIWSSHRLPQLSKCLSPLLLASAVSIVDRSVVDVRRSTMMPPIPKLPHDMLLQRKLQKQMTKRRTPKERADIYKQIAGLSATNKKNGKLLPRYCDLEFAETTKSQI